MKRTTHIIIALALGMLIGSAATAFAASDTVTATIAKLRFVVNGEERELRTDPIVVKGTTYLPVREVANMLGYDVIYRADSRTIEFNATDQPESKGGNQSMNRTIEEIKQDPVPNPAYEGTDIVLDFDFNTLDISEWTSLHDIRHSIRQTGGLPPNSHPTDHRRLLVLESENARVEFVVPNILGGNKLFRNADGDELLIIDGETYIRNETAAKLLGQ